MTVEFVIAIRSIATSASPFIEYPFTKLTEAAIKENNRKNIGIMQNKFTEISIIGKIVLGVWDPENYAKIFATCNYAQQQKKTTKKYDILCQRKLMYQKQRN